MTLDNTYNFWHLMLGDGRGYLIPLDTPGIARKGLDIYNPQSAKARLLKRCLSIGFASGILTHLLPSAGIAQANDDGVLDHHLFDFLKTTLADDELTFAVSLGTPSAHRKPVIQIMKKNKILGYAKIGWNQLTLPMVRNEAETLSQLADASLKSLRVPSLLFGGNWQGKYISIQSAPSGETAPAPAKLNPSYGRILENLSLIAAQETNLESCSYWQKILVQAKNCQHPYYQHVLSEAVSVLTKRLTGKSFRLHFRHGDFAPWNIIMAEGHYFVYDWEYASREAAAGWDLFHFFLQTHWLLHKLPAGKTFRALLNGQHLVDMFKKLYPDLQTAFRDYLLVYLIERLAFYATEDPRNLSSQEYLADLINLMLYRD